MINKQESMSLKPRLSYYLSPILNHYSVYMKRRYD